MSSQRMYGAYRVTGKDKDEDGLHLLIVASSFDNAEEVFLDIVNHAKLGEHTQVSNIEFLGYVGNAPYPVCTKRMPYKWMGNLKKASST